MLSYLKRKFIKWRTRTVFREYNHKIEINHLERDGRIELAVWMNPLEKPKHVTQTGVDFFRKFIKPGDLAIDIGTHMGDTTVPMALAAGVHGKVLGFDPNPHVYKIFAVNASLNKDKTNITPLPYAIMPEDGEYYFSSSEASFNNGGVAKNAGGHGGYTLNQKVTGINLEKYLKANHADKLPVLSFIKIDTEGNDKSVLESIITLLESHKPTVIAECFYKLMQTEREDLYDLLAGRGYVVHRFEEFEVDTPITKIEKTDMMKWKHFDMLAVHKERLSSVSIG